MCGKDFLCYLMSGFLKKLWSVDKKANYKTVHVLGTSFSMPRSATMTANRHKDEIFQRYANTLSRLRQEVKHRQIRVAFVIQERQKWNCQTLYMELSKIPCFDVTLVFHGNTMDEAEMLRSGFVCQTAGNTLVADYDTSMDVFDIVFYQQPWGVHGNLDILKISKHALTCYVPYCFYMADSDMNYILGFHGLQWRYFVDSDIYVQEYKNKFGAVNCVSLGHPKFDQYRQANRRQAAWKFKDKRRIIYAPHHSFSNSWGHGMATWQWNGRLILDLAKQHQDTTEWVFRPHPDFYDSVIRFKVASEKQIDQYFSEWDTVGTIDLEGDYYGVFETSDCLITDSISFLAEYLPSGHPLLHLRSSRQSEPFSRLGDQIISQYYQIHNPEELKAIFKRVVLEGDDWMREKRLANIACLGIDANKTAGEKIACYLKDILLAAEGAENG